MVQDSKNKVKLPMTLGKYLKHVRDKRLKCQKSHLLIVKEKRENVIEKEQEIHLKYK